MYASILQWIKTRNQAKCEKNSTYYIGNIILSNIKVPKLADSWPLLRSHTGCFYSWSSWCNPPFPNQFPRSSWPASSPCLRRFHSQRRAPHDSDSWVCYCKHWNEKWNDKALTCLRFAWQRLFFVLSSTSRNICTGGRGIRRTYTICNTLKVLSSNFRSMLFQGKYGNENVAGIIRIPLEYHLQP